MYSHSSNCIYSIANLMGTLLSSLCQMLNKETVGLIPVIGLWLLTLNTLLVWRSLFGSLTKRGKKRHNMIIQKGVVRTNFVVCLVNHKT